jgi:hypothetical protein
VVRCFEHCETGFNGYPDFGKDYCAKCGLELDNIKMNEKRWAKFCDRCCQHRSGRNVRHVHGKDCIIKEE